MTDGSSRKAGTGKSEEEENWGEKINVSGYSL